MLYKLIFGYWWHHYQLSNKNPLNFRSQGIFILSLFLILLPLLKYTHSFHQHTAGQMGR